MSTINFDTLPEENSSNFELIPKGKYYAKIVKAEMRQGKDETKPPYLNIETEITDPESNSDMGKFWIMLTESPHDLPRWQLRKFIEALRLPITGEFELKDLTKMTVGKSLAVDIDIKPDNQNKDRNVVDISADCFYPISQNTTSEMINDVFSPPTEETTSQPTMSQY